jgi:hypothetical protein
VQNLIINYWYEKCQTTYDSKMENVPYIFARKTLISYRSPILPLEAIISRNIILHYIRKVPCKFELLRVKTLFHIVAVPYHRGF